MKLPDFDFLEPESVAEACALLAGDPEGSVLMAGGTDVLVLLKERQLDCRRLVSLGKIEALRTIEVGDGGLTIGAMATVNQVAHHPGIRERYPGIVDAAMSLAADQVRNQATVAGNLCMAVPSADTAPILLVHDASLRVASPDGERTVPLRELFLGPRETVLKAGDVVVAIEVPPAGPGEGSASLRHGGRASLSLPVASAAAWLRLEGGVCTDARIALGSVAPTPLLVPEAGDIVAGCELMPEVLAAAGAAARAAARPIDDMRGSKSFRLELVDVLTRRVLTTAAIRAGAA